mmetsp:Transcript_17254/g.25656  ORF Transcript_17254/g.25656 Transcript_17254/m.25656 type:complete len:835 (+) Transcript_17254:196-2700(+)|eukprot:CAMPEP_0201557726 /NCGR_PEP_ID=MMETSP0173_2-20130828/63630_1 /ASSEMBLY_ACC=CAM_ASM_000268 /TAXON_ID=218659 /ORGANISM="Vexillifera sp., Strain DIVA3 564/2" /LENGTH=834 /DNA_ID=CAMNT_0047970745 /DNA_START=135 /DNA_END=2639 /DNA_ORIENTATION=-
MSSTNGSTSSAGAHRVNANDSGTSQNEKPAPRRRRDLQTAQSSDGQEWANELVEADRFTQDLLGKNFVVGSTSSGSLTDKEPTKEVSSAVGSSSAAAAASSSTSSPISSTANLSAPRDGAEHTKTTDSNKTKWQWYHFDPSNLPTELDDDDYDSEDDATAADFYARVSNRRVPNIYDCLRHFLLSAESHTPSTMVSDFQKRIRKSTGASDLDDDIVASSSRRYLVFYETLFFNHDHYNYFGFSKRQGWVFLSISERKMPLSKAEVRIARNEGIKLSKRVYSNEYESYYQQRVAYRWGLRTRDFDRVGYLALGGGISTLSKSQRLLKAFLKLSVHPYGKIPFVELPDKSTPGRLLALERCLLPNQHQAPIFRVSSSKQCLSQSDFYGVKSSDDNNVEKNNDSAITQPAYNGFLKYLGRKSEHKLSNDETVPAIVTDLSLMRMMFYPQSEFPSVTSFRSTVDSLPLVVVFADREEDFTPSLCASSDQHIFLVVSPTTAQGNQSSPPPPGGKSSTVGWSDSDSSNPSSKSRTDCWFRLAVVARRSLFEDEPVLSFGLAPSKPGQPTPSFFPCTKKKIRYGIAAFVAACSVSVNWRLGEVSQMYRSHRADKIEVIANSFERQQERLKRRLGSDAEFVCSPPIIHGNSFNTSSTGNSVIDPVKLSPSQEALKKMELQPLSAKEKKHFLEGAEKLEAGSSKSSGQLNKTVTLRLVDVLSNKNDLGSFREFLLSEFSLENLAFFLRVQHFKFNATATKKDQSKMMSIANQIYDDHVERGCRFPINLPGRIKERLIKRFSKMKSGSSFDPQVFDEAQGSIFRLLQTDSFRRYLNANKSMLMK